MIIRAARPADAGVMANLREACIRQLCGADHHNDSKAVEAWVGQPDKFARLLEHPAATLIVVDIDNQIAGLGGLSADCVTLNYVHPNYRFRGVSKAVMQSLEARMRMNGFAVGRLNSTATALKFYRSIGWADAGLSDADAGQPMTKDL